MTKKVQTRKTIKTPTLFRTAQVDLQRMDGEGEDDRRVSMVFSSEEPVDRWFGTEILDHGDKSLRLDFFESGRAPFLLDHDHTKQCGVIEEAYLDGRVGRAVVRFGSSELGESALRDIRDGIKLNISVGYRIHEMKLDKSGDDGDVYRVMDWEPMEASLVSIPADKTVGVGRADETGTEHDTVVIEIEEREETITMSDEPKNPAVEPQLTTEQLEKIRNDKIEAEESRINNITALGTRHNLRKLADEHIRKGTSLEEFRGHVLDNIDDKPLDTSHHELGMERKDVQRYSIMRAVRGVFEQMNGGRSFKDIAPFEFECSMNIADKIDKEARGFYVPMDIQRGGLWRDPNQVPALQRMHPGLISRAAPMDTSENSDLVATMHLAGSFIEALRAESVVFSIGARVLSGLTGNVDIPRNDTPAVFGWIAEDGSSSDTEIATGTVSMSPKTVSGSVPITRRLMLQSSPDVELMVRNDLVVGAALAIDNAALQGSGSSNQPKGILNQSGIGTSTIASAGDPTWAEIVEFETDVAEANGLRGSLYYLMTPTVAGAAKVKTKDSGSGRFVIEGNTTNGYPVISTTQMPSNGILFGNFNECLVGMWGMLDINVDMATDAAKGGVVLRAFQDADTNVRHAASFSKNA